MATIIPRRGHVIKIHKINDQFIGLEEQSFGFSMSEIQAMIEAEGVVSISASTTKAKGCGESIRQMTFEWEGRASKNTHSTTYEWIAVT